MKQEIQDGFRILVEAYRKETGVTLTTVSKKLYGHSGFLRDFLAGKRTASVETLEKMIVELERVWPRGVPWPAVPPVSFRSSASPADSGKKRFPQKLRHLNNDVKAGIA